MSKTVSTAMRDSRWLRFVKALVEAGAKAGGVGASGIGGVLPAVDTQFLHARDESRAVDAHAGCGPIGPPNTAIALGEGAHDLFALLLGILAAGPLPIQRIVDGFLHDACYVFLHGLDAGGRSHVGDWLA